MIPIVAKYEVEVDHKKYAYSLKPATEEATFVICEAANIAQEFLNEEVPALLIDLPNLILAEKAYDKKQSEVIRFRVSPDDKRAIEKRALKKGYVSISAYLRDLSLGGV